MMRALPLIAVLAIVLAPVPAAAQLVGTDTAPGSSCAGFPAGATRVTADADQDGAQVVLVCDGTTWNAAAGGDNLGDHTATENIRLNGNWLSGDGGAEGVFVSATGAVGVGTSSPVYNLDVVGSGADTYLMVKGTATNANTYLRFNSRVGGVDRVAHIKSEWGGLLAFFPAVDATDSFKFQNAAGSATVLDVDTQNSRVGIGLTTPADKLHVAGGQIRVDNDTNATNKGCIRYDGTGNKLQFSHDCTTFSDMGTATESDPQVSTLTANKWCAANAGGTAIDCTQDAPSGGPPSGCPNAGDTCSDGTKYVDGNIYVTAADNDPADTWYDAKGTCEDLYAAGSHNWRLPSWGEAVWLYSIKATVGGFSNAIYWTSEEVSSTNAMNIDFTNGNGASAAKTTTYRVRCVRLF